MAVNDILEIGRQGLTANRTALQTTSSNITNANTPGYTRRKAVIETNTLSIPQGMNMGGGVEVKRVMRTHDGFVHKQLVEESQAFGGLRAKADNLSRIELVAQRDGQHVGELVNKFFSDMRELSANPETSSLRNIVQSSGFALSNGIKGMNNTLEDLKQNLDMRINDSINQVNVLTKELASLNQNIMQANARKDPPLDLEDRRDQLMRDLSQKLNFQTHTDDLGQVAIVTNGCVLVQGGESNDLFALRTPAEGKKGAGSLDIFVTNHGDGRKVTGGITDGELGGMMHVRDKVLNPAIEHLDIVAHHIATSVNAVHREGSGMDGVTGREFFKDLGETHEGAAHKFELSDAVQGNHETIAAGFSGQTPGDNQIALRIADLQNEKGLTTTGLGDLEHHTINESLNALVGKIGVETQRENNFFHHQQDVVNQLENYRQSIEGVNLEEEAVNMMQYQTVFNASAKAMKVGEELYETILRLKT